MVIEIAELKAEKADLLKALKACMKELRYYPGEENLEGDTLIDKAYNLGENAIPKAKP